MGATINAVHALMQMPCVALQAAPAPVSQAHQPTGPVVPATMPDAAKHET